jgi:hypothetical protein
MQKQILGGPSRLMMTKLKGLQRHGQNYDLKVTPGQVCP